MRTLITAVVLKLVLLRKTCFLCVCLLLELKINIIVEAITNYFLVSPLHTIQLYCFFFIFIYVSFDRACAFKIVVLHASEAGSMCL